MRVNERGKAVAGAGDRVQIHEGGFSVRHRVAERHARRSSFVQTENIVEVRGHVLQEWEFARTGIAENMRHAQIAQDLVGCLSHRGHVLASDLPIRFSNSP